jgi:hypothetical protein
MGVNELGKSEVVNWEELVTSNMMQIEALLRILENKGLVSSDEFYQEVVQVKKEMEKKIKDLQKEN